MTAAAVLDRDINQGLVAVNMDEGEALSYTDLDAVAHQWGTRNGDVEFKNVIDFDLIEKLKDGIISKSCAESIFHPSSFEIDPDKTFEDLDLLQVHTSVSSTDHLSLSFIQELQSGSDPSCLQHLHQVAGSIKTEPVEADYSQSAADLPPFDRHLSSSGGDSQFSNSLSNSGSEVDVYSSQNSSPTSSVGGTSHVTSEAGTKPPQSHNPSHILPPCRVCGEKASGFHYGANTCEACKGFFRRSLKKKVIDYRCLGDKKCSVGVGRRSSCPSCRYKKCLAMGMSKEAIKTGRYTHEKRTQDIVEIKKLQKRENMSDIFRDMSQEEIDEIITTVDRNHQEHFKVWHAWILKGDLEQQQKKYYDQYQLKKQMFGTQKPVSKEEYNTFYQTTGIDVDERQQTMKSLLRHMELTVSKFVTFAKGIPGFSSLTVEDQASLIKMARFEIWLIGAFKFMNTDLGVICGPFYSVHLEEIGKLWDLDFVTAVFNFGRSMQKLGLSHNELSLLKCVVLLFRDRCDLQNPEKVEEIQWKLLTCLRSVISAQSNSPGKRLTQIMDRVIRLRDLSDWHIKIAKKLVLDMPLIQQHPLILELMSF